MKRTLSLLLAALLLAALLGACGQQAPAPTSAPATPAPTAAPATPAPTPAPTPEPTPEPGSDHYPVTISTYNYAKEPIEVTFEKKPEKVVCTNQTQTEMLLYFGLDDVIAGTAYLDGTILEDLQAQYDALKAAGKELTVKGYPAKETVLALEPDKSFVGLLGPNGSGKTTLLKSIYRVLKPSGGAIYVDGRDIREMSHRETAKRMGVVSQFNALSFDFTVEEMVLMGRAPHKRAFDRDTEEDYRIAEDALRRVNMLEFRDRSFQTLSGGEKQRIILARALAQQVEMFILDEPTNHLDIKYQIQIMDVVKSMGVGVLAALHDLNLTLMYCTYVYVLKNGQIVAHGPTEEVVTEQLIREVYEVDCAVSRNPVSGKLGVTFFSALREENA